MTTPPAVELRAANPADGCASCNSPRTVLLSPYHGRQCPDHITLPPGPWRRDLALEMADLGRADCALQYLAAWLAREIDARFRRAVQAVTG